jgi:hypothetical protein
MSANPRAAYLDTFSHQARPFYEEFGYVVFGTLDDFPKGHARFSMRKRLDNGLESSFCNL